MARQHEYHLQNVIYANQAAIFGTLTDFESLQRFVPNIVRAHRLGPKGPFAIGTQWEETRNLLFLRGALHLEVTDVQPVTRVQWVLRDGNASFTYTFSLLPSTTICGREATDVLCEVTCKAGCGRTVAARLAGFMQQKDRLLLEQLKRLIEDEQTGQSCPQQAAGSIAVC